MEDFLDFARRFGHRLQEGWSLVAQDDSPDPIEGFDRIENVNEIDGGDYEDEV